MVEIAELQWRDGPVVGKRAKDRLCEAGWLEISKAPPRQMPDQWRFE